MRKYLISLTWAALLVCAGSQAYGQAGIGYTYPPRYGYPQQQWPTYPAQPYNGMPQMAYPAMRAAWYPPQGTQPIPYAPAIAPVAAFPQQSAPAVEAMPFAEDDPMPAPVVESAPKKSKAVVPAASRHGAGVKKASPAACCSTDCNAETAFSPEMDPNYVPGHPQAAHEVDASATCCQPANQDESGFRVGASLLLLKPFFERNPAFVTTTGLGGAAPVSSTTNFDYGYDSALLAWAGYTCEGGLGFRGRYFNLDESSHPLFLTNQQQTLANGGVVVNQISQSPALPDPRAATGTSLFGSPGALVTAGMGADHLVFLSDLRIRTFDAEVVKEFDLGCTLLVLSGGGRYAQISQKYNGFQSSMATVTSADGLTSGTVTESATVGFDQNFYGGGPTLALQAHVGVGCGLAFYGNARGSVLAGASHQSFFSSRSISDPAAVFGGNSIATDTNQNRQNDLLPIGEAEVGVEYGCALCGTTVFARAGAISQVYWGLGNASSPDGNLSLFGVQFSLGIGY